MNKKDAAEFLGVSERTLTNYTTKGRLKVNYIKGKTRDVADFNTDELERLKEEIESGSLEPSNRESGNRETGNTETGNPESGNRETSIVRASFPIRIGQPGNQETAQGAGSPNFYIVGTEQMTQLLESVRPDEVPLDRKPLLTFGEAAQLSGISEKLLRDAAKANELRARKIGRSQRIRQTDLKEWIDAQFE